MQAGRDAWMPGHGDGFEQRSCSNHLKHSLTWPPIGISNAEGSSYITLGQDIRPCRWALIETHERLQLATAFSSSDIVATQSYEPSGWGVGRPTRDEHRLFVDAAASEDDEGDVDFSAFIHDSTDSLRDGGAQPTTTVEGGVGSDTNSVSHQQASSSSHASTAAFLASIPNASSVLLGSRFSGATPEGSSASTDSPHHSGSPFSSVGAPTVDSYDLTTTSESTPSTSPPFASKAFFPPLPANSTQCDMSAPPSAPGKTSAVPPYTVPLDWRTGTQSGPFTVDSGGGGGGGAAAATTTSAAKQQNSARTAPMPDMMRAALDPNAAAIYNAQLAAQAAYMQALSASLSSAGLSPPSTTPGTPSALSAGSPYGQSEWIAAQAQAANYAAAFGRGGGLPPLAMQGLSMAQPYPLYSGYPRAHSHSPYASPIVPQYPSPFGAPGQSPMTNPLMDPSMYALHASLLAQRRSQAYSTTSSAAQSPVGSPLTDNGAGAAFLSSSLPQSSNLPNRSEGSSSRAGGPRRTSSFIKAARGMSASTAGANGAHGGAAHSRQRTAPSLSTSGAFSASPLASPSITSPSTEFAGPNPPTLPRGSLSTKTSPAHSRAASVSSQFVPVVPTPPMSRPVSPKPVVSAPASASASTSAQQAGSPPPVDYDFSSLEHDLDQFSSTGFASAAAAAMSTGTGTRRGHTGVGAYGVGGYGSPQSPYAVAAESTPSPKVVAEVLGQSVFASSASRTPSSNEASPIDFAALLQTSNAGSTSRKASPAATGLDSMPSPTDSTIIDDESAEALSRKDPIAAQVWRMFNKAKNTLPNGARMENLTWRLMSMTLKKRRQETAAAEAEANALATMEAATLAMPPPTSTGVTISTPEAEREEAKDDVLELRSRNEATRLHKSGPAGDVLEEEARGRRGRSGPGTASASASESPENAQEDDFMDWRAKSQSRSRSRAPDAMDWRAASRSRSRAPDFRVSVAPPTVDSATATANFSRFYGDNTPVSNPPGAQTAHVQLAASLGLSATDDMFSSFDLSSTDFGGSQGSPAAPSNPSAPAIPISGTSTVSATTSNSLNSGSQFSFAAGSGGNPAASANLSAIESTLNQLIDLQSLSNSNHSKSHSSGRQSANVSPSSSLRGLAKSFVSDEAGLPEVRKASGDSAYASLAQQQLQSLVGRKSSNAGRASTSTASSSAYLNAATLAQSSRPFAFAPPSGLSLARPSGTISPRDDSGHNSQPQTPFFDAPHPFSYPQSAPGPGNGFINSPIGSLYQETHDVNSASIYDYFNRTDLASTPAGSAFTSPYLGGTSAAGQGTFDPSASMTHVNPSHLLSLLQTPAAYDSDSSLALTSPGDASRHGTPSPPDPPQAGTGAKPDASGLPSKLGPIKSPIAVPRRPKQPSAPKAQTGSNVRVSASSPDLVSLGHHAALSPILESISATSTKLPKVPGASASRTHSRSNTISVQASIPEARPLAPSLVGTTSATPSADGGDSEVVKCLNCQTTNTPLWRRDVDGRPLCNACGLFRNLHGVDRPANLNTGVIKKRNRARGPKDPTATKKSHGRSVVRRNSLGASAAPISITPSSSSRVQMRQSIGPYPSTAARAEAASASSTTHSATNSQVPSPS
ncbi:BZ3500_MvSof-1268-A1-R1_Chr2-1g04571 [Microbotryum saponariae]|uniref:BZ3500_MvSof-1268-A1-R1_Chr2-1g04571 protein n=1 Tax=Microbotryum saponariae TaxID=289078 RepID=A0A2X0KDB5_9BASI|nr:BZ3500_MvSof-1268-A1-R1_Chr2-1g04571 [Microbotryum saponariae]SCZ92049.1 BZ3501_MvSof-1269-A2-R1_Chr2-1g04227 [Microbotryum saponariae]